MRAALRMPNCALRQQDPEWCNSQYVHTQTKATYTDVKNNVPPKNQTLSFVASHSPLEYLIPANGIQMGQGLSDGKAGYEVRGVPESASVFRRIIGLFVH